MRSQFELDPSIIYLNSGTHSLCPRTVVDATRRYQAEYARNPSMGLFEVWGKLWGVQKEVAAFFRADPKDLFLRTNVTHVMNEFVLGTPLPEGSEILLSDLEYGAISNLCRYRAERDGLNLRTFHLPSRQDEMKGLSRESLAEQVIQSIGPKTRLLVISHIITGNGLILPLDLIARETRARGVLLAVDGAHAPGSMELDFSKLQDVDFYGGNLHKWMIAPKGTAFGWVAPRNQEQIQPIMAGWTTFETAGPFAFFGEGSRFQGKMMLVGCHDFSPFLALRETIEFWRKNGETAIRARIYDLQAKLEALLDHALGWESVSPPAGELRGPLFSYALPEKYIPLGFEFLYRVYREHRLQITVTTVHGRPCLRLTPHIYNDEAELERAAAILSGSG